jgi:hypothetical protein
MCQALATLGQFQLNGYYATLDKLLLLLLLLNALHFAK